MEISPATTMRGGLVAALEATRRCLVSDFVSDLDDLAVDFATALLTPDGAVALTDNQAHLGSVAETARAILSLLGSRLRHGDIVVTNDPYSGGTHVQDFTALACFGPQGPVLMHVALRAHLFDIGGNVKGGYYPQAEEIWAEGVRITPMYIRRSGNRDGPTFKSILLNSRTPESLGHNLEAMERAADLGMRQAQGLVEQYGTEAFSQALLQYIIDTEQHLRGQIQEWPDGEYQGQRTLEQDGKGRKDLTVAVKVGVHGDSLTLDFTESEAQSTSFVNSTFGNTCRYALLPIATVLDQSALKNSGLMRPLEIRTKKGTLVDPLLGAATGWSPFHVGGEIVGAVADALDSFLPPGKKVGPSLAGVYWGSARPAGYDGLRELLSKGR